jgi:hypothetical protein
MEDTETASNYEKVALENVGVGRPRKQEGSRGVRCVGAFERNKFVKDKSLFFYKLRELLKLVGT